MEKPGGPSAGPSSMPLVWTVLRGTLLLLSGACMLLMLAYMMFSRNLSWINNEYLALNWQILYGYARDKWGLSVILFAKSQLANFLFLQLFVMGAAWLALLSKNLPQGRKIGWVERFKAKAQRVLAFQLWPRKFFAWWCAGFNVLDLIVVTIWALINGMVLGQQMRLLNYDEPIYMGGMKMPISEKGSLEKLGFATGILLEPNIMVLFMPIAHSSFLNYLTGIPYERMVRYHRWLGHATIWVLTAHGFSYYIYWAKEHEFWSETWAWQTANVNYATGTIAYLVGILLWVTSTNIFRRMFFEWFYRLHLVCFVLFFLFSMMHYSASWTYFAPGMLVYFVDLIFRAGQLANVTTVTAADVKESGGITTLQLQVDKIIAEKGVPLRECYLNFPTISRWQWHPFSVAHGPDANGVMTFQIKKYGRYTAALIAALRQRKSLPVRATGPIGNDSGRRKWEHYDSLVLLAGGVGCAPIMCLLSDLVHRRTSGKAPADRAPARVHLVWTARNAEELTCLDPAILRAANAADGWLTLSLHYTGKEVPLKGIATKADSRVKICAVDPLKKASPGGSTGSDHSHSGGSGSLESSESASDLPCASPYGWSIARVVQPKVLNDLQLALAHFFVYAGSWCATVLIYAWIKEGQTTAKVNGTKADSGGWRFGLVLTFAFCIMTLGLGYLFTVWPVHLYRWWRSRRAGYPDKVSAYQDEASELIHGCRIAEGKLLRHEGDASVEISTGRPDIKALLDRTAEEASHSSTVGVYVAGPVGMARPAATIVSRMNDKHKGSPHFDCHVETSDM